MITHKFLHKETAINIKVDIDINDELIKEILFRRKQLEHYIQKNPYFYSSYQPVDVEKNAPVIVKVMADAGIVCGVGPMASVAGTISELAVRKGIELGAKSILVENGGDISCYNSEGTYQEFIVKIFSGNSGLSNKIGLKLKPRGILGVCTSSASVGHSISFGNSDSVTVISKNTAVADACATAIGNVVKGKPEVAVNCGIEYAKKLPVDGVIIICRGYVGTYGELPEIVEID